jgi:hypothetical protein
MFQRQKEVMTSGQQLQRGQTLISQEGLWKMGKGLLRLCDSIERHGLVDYQHGVWEEQIIAGKCGPFPLHEMRIADDVLPVLEECLDLYDASVGQTGVVAEWDMRTGPGCAGGVGLDSVCSTEVGPGTAAPAAGTTQANNATNTDRQPANYTAPRNWNEVSCLWPEGL